MAPKCLHLELILAQKGSQLSYSIASSFTVHCNGDISYTVVPYPLSFTTQPGEQCMHLNIAGNQDTDISIVIPGSSFSRNVKLHKDNNWAWMEKYNFPAIITYANVKGIRIQASNQVNIHVRFEI